VRDGTKVPVSIAYRKDLKTTGGRTRRILLYIATSWAAILLTIRGFKMR